MLYQITDANEEEFKKLQKAIKKLPEWFAGKFSQVNSDSSFNNTIELTSTLEMKGTLFLPQGSVIEVINIFPGSDNVTVQIYFHYSDIRWLAYFKNLMGAFTISTK